MSENDEWKKDPILIIDKYVNNVITEKDVQSLYKKLNIKSCLTCYYHSSLNFMFCMTCIRFPIPRNKDLWRERK